MITIDTSGMLALVDRKERHHKAASAALLADSGPYLISAGALCEIGYVILNRLGLSVLDQFLADIEAGAYVIDCGDPDLARARELLARYADLGLSYTDAAVIACTERNGGRVLTFDHRDFDVVAREGRITVLH